MGWFDEQIRERIKKDNEMFADAHSRMESIANHKKTHIAFQADKKLVEKAVGDILNYYHVKVGELPGNVKELEDILEYLFRPAGIMRREVTLGREWYKDAAGAMLGTKKKGGLVALIPDRAGGYYYNDYEIGKKVRINKQTAADIENKAICFYTSLPAGKVSEKEFLRFIIRMLRGRDYLTALVMTLVVTVIGMVTPGINRYLFGEVLESGNYKQLTGAILTLAFASLSACLFRLVRDIWTAGTGIRIGLAVESSVMMRILSLPADFFKRFSPGELVGRVGISGELCSLLFDAILSAGLTAVFSLIYIGQITAYAPKLAVTAILVPSAILAVSLITAKLQFGMLKEYNEKSGKENGFVYALIGGMTKIKNGGAEKRVFAKWADKYADAAEHIYEPPVLVKLHPVCVTAISLAGIMAIYYKALSGNVAVADYMAFYSAYGIVMGAFISMSEIILKTATIRAGMYALGPILETEPEISSKKQVVTRISGGIELNNVSFRYQESMPNILDNVSLKIRPGQYVAVVGKTGCGKSTLLRLLLGFERPDKGAIYYDGRDISSMDLKSLRKKIGVVLQNGKLFPGDIYSNITISAPELSVEQAWEAAEMAGLAEDIRNMPMGMSTIVSEGGSRISGGQKQRLLIARAVAGKPRILMFDEATSALDNITQKIVSDSLSALKCTRIVIAHRLSTIKQCDRILVLDNGKIVEDGTYEELIEKNGVFSELVERQKM